MAMAARPLNPVQDAYSPGYGGSGGGGARSTSTSRPSSLIASTASNNHSVAQGIPAAAATATGAATSTTTTTATTTTPPTPLPRQPNHHYHHLQHNRPHTYYGARFHEDFDAASQRGSIVLEGPSAVQAASAARPGLQRSVSSMSYSHSRSATPTRSSSTLKKRSSLSKRGSMRRSGSRKSLRAGSVRSLNLGDREKYTADGLEDANSAFAVPIPTDGNPTEVLANRFQSWRKILKDLIVFFKEIQKSYETRSKLFLSASNVLNNSAIPSSFLKTGGLGDATEILRDFHRQGYIEANKAAEVESELVNQLMGLRNDLQKKTKEIKNLGGDFKNTVGREVENTRKMVRNLHEALGLVDTDPSATAGRGDPFIVRLSVEKQIDKQIEEENYLHMAYVNLENSGRELESIVVSEIQKAYSGYANILKREADEANDAADKLYAGPVSMPQDHEWNSFIASTDDMVDPRLPLRNVENISYPGKDHPAAAEVRSGMLERKSKYLKSYTPGWYVLSPTHLHEFKSADLVASQTPVMSLHLPEQKLGTHSEPDTDSHKFMLKGRKTGTMHRGHSWVFRAESHETMMSWYGDIESLISKTGEARNAFVRRHVRSISGTSFRTSSANSELMEDEDEADRTPYSSESVVLNSERPTSQPRQPGGRFPSDVQIDRHMQEPLSPSSGESSGDRDLLAVVGSPGPDRSVTPLGEDGRPSLSDRDGDTSNAARTFNRVDGNSPVAPIERHDSYYGEWIGSAAFAARQQQLARQQDNASSDNEPAAPQSDRNHAASDPNLLASTGSILSQDPSSAGLGRNRRESASTAPTTTNVTDFTNNTITTVPTSIDDNHEPSIIGLGEFAGTNKRDAADGTLKEDPTSASIKMDGASVSGFSARNLSPGRSTSTGVDMPAAVGEDLKPSTTGPKKGSVSTLELKIPGHYPPNVTA